MLVPHLGTRPLHEIQPRDIRELMTKLIARGAYDAKNAYLHLSVMLKQAVSEDLISVSPCASIDKKALFRGRIKPRQRALTPEELQAFWAGTGKLGAPYREVFRLLLLTGARLNEIAKARWVELDPGLRQALRAGPPVDWLTVPAEIKVLRVPAIRFKSNREHVIRLSGDALTIIEQLWRDRSGEFLFRSTAALSTAKARLDAHMLEHLRSLAEDRGEDPAKVELAPWITHDLRRVVRSGLAALGVRFEVAENILGHSIGGLHATYNIHTYDVEQREALEKWAARVREIVTPQPPAPTVDSVAQGNVVSLPKQRRRVSS